MARFPTPTHAVRIAAVETRRMLRSFRDRNRIQLLVVGAAVLFGLAVTAAAVLGALVAGQRLADGAVEDPVGAATMAAAGLSTLVVSLTAYITVLQTGDVDNRDGLLTTVPHRDVVGGLLLAGFLRALGPFLPSTLAAVGAFGVGTGSPSTLALATLTLASVLLAAYVTGFAVGLVVKYLLGRSETVARHRVALGMVAFLAYMALLVTDSLGEILAVLVDALRGSPVAWYADLALLGVVPDASVLRAGGALVGSGVVVVGGVVAAVRVAGRLWYADPVATEGGPTGSVAAESRLDSVVGRPTAWVARKSWLRARRAPITLVYVAYPLFLLLQPVRSSLAAGQVVSTLPATVALYGAWATGAAFTLNPLGDEGAALPVTLMTGLRGRQFVGGLVVAGVTFGVPVTVSLTAAVATLSTLPLGAVAVTVAAAAVLPVGATALAVGVGTAFPKFDTAEITRNREVVVPSIWGFGVYSLVLLVVSVPATVVQVPTVLAAIASATGVAPTAVRVGGLALTAALLAGAAFWSYRFAIRRFDEYTLD